MVTADFNQEASQLRAGQALAIFSVYLGVQLLIGMAAGVIGTAVGQMRGKPFQASTQSAEFLQVILAPATLVAMVGAGAAMVLLARTLIREHLKDTSPSGAAWVVGPWKRIAQGLGLGLAVALVSALSVSVFGSPPDPEKLGPMARMALMPGLTQIIWLIVVLGFAPPLEELLFRGVLYAGLRNSFGAFRAAVLTTGIFVFCHITEVIFFLPSLLGITALAVLALWLRLRTRAIGPAIAAHFAYNGVVALAAMAST